jgi:hypothetical protein
MEAFTPFLYGDHLWATTTRFVEFHGLEHLRPPRGAPAGARDALRPEHASLGGRS